MKYFVTTLLFLFVMGCAGTVSAQQANRPKRPVRNPPQFPNIIDLENKDAPPATKAEAAKPEAAAAKPVTAPEVPPKSVDQLSAEIRALGQEIRALNIRQQAQLDLMKLGRIELRVERYDRDLRQVRERLAALDGEEKTLLQLLTRESLLVQTATMATANREVLMQQIAAQHEARLRAVRAEHQRLQPIEADLAKSLGIYQQMQTEMETSIQKAEDSLKPPAKSDTDKSDTAKPESKSQN